MAKRRYNKIPLHNDQDETLCKLVGSHSCLYDVNHPLYKDMNTREHAWNLIGTKMKLEAKICKSRWRNIRDSYKRNKRNGRIGPNIKGRPIRWALYDYIKFLDDIQDTKRNSSKQDDESPEMDTNNKDDTDSSISEVIIKNEFKKKPEKVIKRPLKIKLKKRIDKPQEKIEIRRFETESSPEINLEQVRRYIEDDTDVFFRSMAMTVKKFHHTILTEAKKKICNIVMDFEVENEQFLQKNSSSDAPVTQKIDSQS